MAFLTVNELRKYQHVYDIKTLLDLTDCIGGFIAKKDSLELTGYESYIDMAVMLTKVFAGGEYPKSNDINPICHKYDDTTKTAVFLLFKP